MWSSYSCALKWRVRNKYTCALHLFGDFPGPPGDWISILQLLLLFSCLSASCLKAQYSQNSHSCVDHPQPPASTHPPPQAEPPPSRRWGSADQLQQAQDQFLERYWINVTAANTHIEASSSINITPAKRSCPDTASPIRFKNNPWEDWIGKKMENKDCTIVFWEYGDDSAEDRRSH